MAGRRRDSVLKTDKRIKLGIWGLGRGLSFFKACHALNLDVVAGCDFNEHMRRRFAAACPGALVTDDAAKFLDSDIQAVLIATYCPAHAPHALQCLAAGKHVVSEVTAFHTMAEGVQLVEAVEKSNLVYNLAENYPFSRDNLYLAAKWRAGLFGELMYAEAEYVHECRSLCYTYIDGVPVQPGWTVHSWRSWQNFHYYCTHSLGPIMHITGLRPARVVSLPAAQKLAGYLVAKAMDGMGGVAPSLINMNNGAVVRNLMGATTNDSHLLRLWGTRGAAERNSDGLFLRLGGAGKAPRMRVQPRWPELGKWADKMGHGGGDFWVLYQFARHVLLGAPAFFDVYRAADCTIPGVLALRSAVENGRAYDVPDLRRKEARDAWRSDHWAQKPYDTVRGVFPADADKHITGQFATVIKELIPDMVLCRAAQDWAAVGAEVAEPEKALAVFEKFHARAKLMPATLAKARRVIRAGGAGDGAQALREMIEIGEPGRALSARFRRELQRVVGSLKRRAKAAPGGK